MAEVGIICAPTYLWARNHQPARVSLAGWTPALEDLHEPVYHSYVLVAKSCQAQSLEDLRSAKWAFNDPCSLSGYFSVLTSLGGETDSLKERSVFTGGHTQSIEALMAGTVDACAVDSNGWLILKELRERAEKKVRVFTKLGPFPAQPLVLSNAIPQQRQVELLESLTQVIHDPSLLATIKEKFGLVRFVPTKREDFDKLQLMLENR